MLHANQLDASECQQAPQNREVTLSCWLQVKDYITAFVNRRNTVTGVLYKDDTNIFRQGRATRDQQQPAFLAAATQDCTAHCSFYSCCMLLP